MKYYINFICLLGNFTCITACNAWLAYRACPVCPAFLLAKLVQTHAHTKYFPMLPIILPKVITKLRAGSAERVSIIIKFSIIMIIIITIIIMIIIIYMNIQHNNINICNTNNHINNHNDDINNTNNNTNIYNTNIINNIIKL